MRVLPDRERGSTRILVRAIRGWQASSAGARKYFVPVLAPGRPDASVPARGATPPICLSPNFGKSRSMAALRFWSRRTSQYAAFARNWDGSVFVGASRSKAQPDIVLPVRDVRREMVLCEHRAKRAETVSPAFSPNSQRVYFKAIAKGNSRSTRSTWNRSSSAQTMNFN